LYSAPYPDRNASQDDIGLKILKKIFLKITKYDVHDIGVWRLMLRLMLATWRDGSPIPVLAGLGVE